MASRLPWFRMHQDDWLAHARLRRCSVEARGVWIDLVCMMRQEEAGTLVDDVEGMARSIGLPADRLLALLDELRRRDVAEVEVADGRVTVTSRRVTRDLADEEREREEWRDQKRQQRKAPTEACPVDVREMSGAMSGDCPVDVRRESQSQKKNQSKTREEVPAALPLAVPPAAPPAAPPPTILPFERWHRPEAVHEAQREAQARFVAGWATLIADLQRAYPSLDVLGEAAKAYAWESANSDRRKTPKGRSAFLRSWVERAQNSPRPSARGTGPPEVIGRTLQQREEDRAEEIALARFGATPLRGPWRPLQPTNPAQLAAGGPTQ